MMRIKVVNFRWSQAFVKSGIPFIIFQHPVSYKFKVSGLNQAERQCGKGD